MRNLVVLAKKKVSPSEKKELETLNEHLNHLHESLRRVTSIPSKKQMKDEIERIKTRMKQLRGD